MNPLTTAAYHFHLAALAVCCLGATVADAQPPDPDPSTLDHKLLCGYQGWFRCPGDPSGMGWIHWSGDSKRIAPETLTFEMWPDMSEAAEDERYPAPGFTHADGSPAFLFSSANPRTVSRHFQWMRQYGIDGAMLQHFLVDLPDGPNAARHPTQHAVLREVAAAAREHGRVWGLAYDIAGMPPEKIYDALTNDWKRMVDDEHITADPRYLHERGLPIVQVWGYYRDNDWDRMTPDLARRIADFFHADGPYRAYLIGGGSWNWREDPAWRALVYQLDAYSPWNVGNYSRDANGAAHASTGWWADGDDQVGAVGVRWLPVVYPGFGWDNLKHTPPGTSTIPRRGGLFYWEQYRDLARLGVDSAIVAMFDEVDEGTAIFKITSQPPTQAHFLTLEDRPPDWYLQLTREGAKLLRHERTDSVELPIKP